MARALIIKFGAIGDVIMTIPAAHALHQRGVEIDWVCGQAVASLLALYPWINTIVADDRAILTGTNATRFSALLSLWKTLAGRRYSLCATLYYDPRYRLITLPVRAGRKMMLSFSQRDRELLPGRHHTDEYARILLGARDDVRELPLAPIRPASLPPSPLPSLDGRTRIVLAPAGARNMMRDDALRRWPAESYVQLTRELLDRRMDVVLTGGPDDQWIVPAFAGLNATNLIGKLTLVELLALFDESDVVVTHDTGPLHLAGITRAGIVSIFGPTDPRGRLPQRLDTLAIWGGEGFACRPCYDGRNFAPCTDNRCMKQVTVPMVLEQINQILRQRQTESQPPRIITPPSTVVAGL
jgi:heptosyltransferase II